MIEVHRILLIFAWFLVGPINVHEFHGIPPVIFVALTLLCLGSALVLRRSFRSRSIALVCVLGLMFYQSLQLIVFGLHGEILRSRVLEHAEVWRFFSVFFTLNLGLALAGALAAFGVALFLEFRNMRLPLASLFPDVGFVKAPSQVVRSVNRLSKLAGVSSPQVSLIDSGSPWAFTARSKQGFELAVSVGLLESLEPEEFDACLAHELSHLKNKDFVVRLFATMAKVGLFARPLSYILEPAIYRARELLADKTAAKLVGGPSALISALAKIHESQNCMLTQSRSIEMACLFNPAGKSRLSRLFDKHPTIDTRIKALQEI